MDDSNDQQKFEAMDGFCRQVWSHTRPIWIAVGIIWVILMVVCYL